jgi:hypothetical protein
VSKHRRLVVVSALIAVAGVATVVALAAFRGQGLGCLRVQSAKELASSDERVQSSSGTTFEPRRVDSVLSPDGPRAEVLATTANRRLYVGGGHPFEWRARKTLIPGQLVFLHTGRHEVLFAAEQALYRSDDQGRSWLRLSCGLILTGVAVSPRDPRTIYIAANPGVDYEHESLGGPLPDDRRRPNVEAVHTVSEDESCGANRQRRRRRPERAAARLHRDRERRSPAKRRRGRTLGIHENRAPGERAERPATDRPLVRAWRIACALGLIQVRRSLPRRSARALMVGPRAQRSLGRADRAGSTKPQRRVRGRARQGSRKNPRRRQTLATNEGPATGARRDDHRHRGHPVRLARTPGHPQRHAGRDMDASSASSEAVTARTSSRARTLRASDPA